jgi:rhodanese-related sulfurtransferase
LTLELRDAGFTQAYALRGGFDAWLATGGPVEAKEECTTTVGRRL